MYATLWFNELKFFFKKMFAVVLLTDAFIG